jgi:BirA family biotin operon repressor/biotin-[acetyl-CoA-carboxylase] ligase
MSPSDLDPLAGWQGRDLGPVEVLPFVDSTNTEALRRIDRGEAGARDVLLAHRQTAGHGSRGRVWHETPGRSLALTAILDWPDGVPVAVATWLGAVAVVDALGGLGLEARIKWPNDVLIGPRKVAGVLAEVRQAGTVTRIALGIGVNVGQEEADFLPGFVTPPTSLRLEGRAVPRLDVARVLLAALDARLAQLPEGGTSIRDAFAGGLGLVGRPVRVSFLDRTIQGRLAGIELDGTVRVGAEKLAGGHVSALREL